MSGRLIALAILVSPLSAQQPRVTVETSGDTVLVVRLGPINMPANAEHDRISQLALQTWQMPAGGWLRGYRVEMVDGSGNVLPSALLHHAELIDLERRDLLRPAYNRVASAGKETRALLLPARMGYPVRRGQRVGINAMVANPTSQAHPAAYVRATLTMVPESTTNVRPVLGFYAETSYDSTGDSSFDLPAGASQRVVNFTVPIAGQVLGVGGHLHDFGTRFVVVRAASPDTIYNAVPRRDSSGVVSGMPRQAMFFGRAVRIAAGEQFVMTVYYDNPTGRLLRGAGMGTFGVVFSPDDLAAWPALDTASAPLRRDLAALRSTHQHPMQTGGHRH